MKRADFKILHQVNPLDAFDAFPHGVCVLDKALRILGLNRFLEALTQFTSDEARGIYFDFILRSSLGSKGNPLLQCLKSKEQIGVEGDIINRGRKKIPVRFTVSPLENPEGQVLGALMIVEDLSALQDLGRKVHVASGGELIIGHSSRMQEIFELLPAISQTDASALLAGETGTGKDILAEAIHRASKRARNPFIKVNCGALPESLLESELFGYVRGAFTGAQGDRSGMFRLAHGGTIYLTEIADLPLPLQVKLLTVLDDREFFPLGGSRKVKVDVRVIAATHHDLRELVRRGAFREDLYFRLNVVRLHLPPLRERDGDIELLMDHFLAMFRSSMKKDIKGFDEKARDILLRHPYPGNVRELRNIVEYAVTVCRGETILPGHLPKYILAPEKVQQAPADGKSVRQIEAQPVAEVPGASLVGQGECTGWSDVQKRMIMESLIKTRGKRSQAAKMLGWGRSTLWRKMKEYGLG